MKISRILLTISWLTIIQIAHAQSTWQASAYQIVTPGYGSFKTTMYAYPFIGKDNGIVRVATEVDGLTGVKIPASITQPLKLKFKEPVKLLIAMPYNVINTTTFEGRKTSIVLDSALSVAGISSYKIIAVDYPKGIYTVNAGGFDSYMIIGVVKGAQQLTSRNAHLPDGKLWEPFAIDGYADNKPMFEILSSPATPVIDAGMPGTDTIRGGFEGGTCVKVGDTYHLFPTERAGQQGMPASFDRVKTNIGHWTSKDALHWTREKPIFISSGTYAIAEEDNPMNDRRAAIWSYNAVFNKQKDRWYGYYLTYTVDKNIAPNHSFGRLWCTVSQTKGMEGIGGPYGIGQLIMEPGLDTQLWEGRQGVASFYPYPVKDGWLGFYAGAFPFAKRSDYPRNGGTGWYIGLAKSKNMDGPWTRLDTTVNPVKSISPVFVENPLVYQMENGAYIALFDGGPDAGQHHFTGMMGYTTSKDGLHWSQARYLPIQDKVNKWWDVMRTPLCFIPEGNDTYTILYAAIKQNKRFHPIGMVKVKFNRAVFNGLTGN